MSTTRFVILGAFLLLATTALAAGGIAELHLDAAAVSEVLGAALPEPKRIDIRGLGELTVRIGPVREVVFLEGGVEASVVLAIDETVFEDEVHLRFVPGIDRLTGSAQLELDGARLAGLPFDLDLSGLIPPAKLPRAVRWDLEMPGAKALTVDCYVQGIDIEDDRLRIELGLVTSE